MRHSPPEKLEIIRVVEDSELSVRQTLKELGIHRSTFYSWYRRFLEDGVEGLGSQKPKARSFWNKIPEEVKEQVVETALDQTNLSPRELACRITDMNEYFISESSVYRILKAHDLITSPAYILMQAGDCFKNPTRRIHELWQTDFTYFRIIGWGWYYLSTVLDDFSRYIIAWKLTTSMTASDVKDTLDEAVSETGVDKIKVKHKPRLLSDNGPCYLSGELKSYLEKRGMTHTRGAPYHPMTQGKIERYHRSMKNIVKLQNYYFPWELETEISKFVDYYNNNRYHEALNNVTPSDVYFDRHRQILTKRDIIKRKTLALRRKQNLNAKVA
jgi:transposase InsO family protein